jgi:hypothetical protein
VRGHKVALLVVLALVVVAPSVIPEGAGAAGPGKPTAPKPTTTTSPPTFPAQPRRIVLIGDSVAASLADGVAAEAARRGLEFAAYTRVGCGLTTGVPVETGNAAFSQQCAAGASAYLDDVRAREPNADVVLWLSSWDFDSYVVDGRALTYRTPEWESWLDGELDAARRRFGRLFLVTVPPRANLNGKPTMAPDEANDLMQLADVYRRFVAKHPTDTGIVDLTRIVCASGPPCPEFVDGLQLRPDLGAHFDAAGANWVAPWFLDAFGTEWSRVRKLAIKARRSEAARGGGGRRASP